MTVFVGSLVLLLINHAIGARVRAGAAGSAREAKLTDRNEVEAFVDEYLQENMEAWFVPGLAITVVEKGEVILSKGYGYADLESKRPMTPEFAVRAGSVSKPVLATAVMQLWEQGLIELDAPTSNYITDIDLDAKYGEASTMAQLLTHVAGCPGQTVLSHAPTIEEWDPLAEVLASDLPPRVFPPGIVMAYSSCDYALLGYAIEQTTGLSYEVAIAENLRNPLGRHDSSYCNHYLQGSSIISLWVAVTDFATNGMRSFHTVLPACLPASP